VPRKPIKKEEAPAEKEKPELPGPIVHVTTVAEFIRANMALFPHDHLAKLLGLRRMTDGFHDYKTKVELVEGQPPRVLRPPGPDDPLPPIDEPGNE